MKRPGKQISEDSEARPSILYCPMGRPFEPCDPEELEPIRQHLGQNRLPTEALAFPRGTHLPDGRLDLCKQRIGPAGMEKIQSEVSECDSTLHLLLGANGLKNQGAKFVATIAANNTSLRTVYLGCNHIEHEGASALAKSLQQNNHVTGLWLKRNPLGPTGLKHLAAMLATNTTLRTLDLVHTHMEWAGLRSLVDVLCNQNQSIRRLYLSGNGFDSEHADLLNRLLHENKSIHSLFLGVNRLGDEGIARITSGLRENKSLTSLSLSCNRIGPQGAWHLAEALEGNETLRALDLGYDKSAPVLGEDPNSIGDTGAAAIAELIGNSKLSVLDLRKNGMTSLGAGVLLEAIDEDTTLRHLLLGKQVSSQSKRAIRKKLNTSPKDSQWRAEDHDDVEAIRSVYRA